MLNEKVTKGISGWLMLFPLLVVLALAIYMLVSAAKAGDVPRSIASIVLGWSNGDSLVAGDFVAGMRRLVDPATASPYAQILDPVVNAASITRGERKPADLGLSAPDDRTVVIRLQNPAPYLLGLLAQPDAFPVHGPSAREERRGLRQAWQPGFERGVRAFRLGRGLARRAEAKPELLERLSDRARAGALRAPRGRGRGVPPVPCRPARRHLHRAAAAVRMDQGKPAGRTAHLATAVRLLLRVQPHEEWWGRGYATEAAGVLVRFGFEVLGAERLFAMVFVGNEASERVLTKLGMRLEAEVKQGTFVRGAWHDVRTYAMLRSMWQAREK